MIFSRKKEYPRKIVHVIGGLAVVGIYLALLYYVSQRVALMGLVVVLIAVFAFEYARLELKLVPFIIGMFRPHERNRPTSSTPMLVGMIVAFAVFDLRIGLTAILMVIVGDTVAHFTRERPSESKRTVEMTRADVAQFAANLVTAYLVLLDWNVAVPMALVAAVTERLSLKLDDNLTVPVLSGFVGQITVWLIS